MAGAAIFYSREGSALLFGGRRFVFAAKRRTAGICILPKRDIMLVVSSFTSGEITMGAKDKGKKETKKEPQKSTKEKRAEKQAKKNSKSYD